MRVIAYIDPGADAEAVQRALLARPGITAVACRSGRHWRQGDYAEPGFAAVYAPSWPAIRATYARAGVVELDGPLASVEPAEPVELAELTPVQTCTIVCPGRHMRDELQAYGTHGAIVAVNEAAMHLDQVDYLVCNDGFIANLAPLAARAGVRVCRRSHWATLSSGPWYALDRLGVIDGMWSVRCALRLAADALQAERIVLIGHDCLPGVGTGTTSWDAGHIESCRQETARDLRALAASGIVIDHVRHDGRIDHYLDARPTSSRDNG